jgi:hypothetical protein
VLMHSRGSSVQDAPVATQIHSRAPSEGEIEPASAVTSDIQRARAASSSLSNVLAAAATQSYRTTPEQGESQGWQHSDSQKLAPVQHRPQQQVPATSAFPPKLEEFTEADRIEKAAQVGTQSAQSAVVARVLGRLGGAVLGNPDEVRRLKEFWMP